MDSEAGRRARELHEHETLRLSGALEAVELSPAVQELPAISLDGGGDALPVCLDFGLLVGIDIGNMKYADMLAS